MIVTKKSQITGKVASMEIDVTEEQLERVANRRQTGEYIQNILPHMKPDEREFIMTGITPDEWKGFMAGI